MGEALALADQEDPEALNRLEKLFNKASSKASQFPPKPFSSILLPGMAKAAPRFSLLESRRRAATVVLAIERYRVANEGQLPKDLEILVPEFLASIPADPFDGQRLRYKRLPSGFVVYSIGPDRVDDGGKERFQRGPQKNFDVTFTVER